MRPPGVAGMALIAAIAAPIYLGEAVAQEPGGGPDDRKVVEISTPQPVKDVILLKSGVFIRSDEGYAKLEPCAVTLVCAQKAGRAEQARPTPAGGLPDGTVAEHAEGDIREAWYAGPTRRYAHGVLGDEFEAGSLVVRTADGETFNADLPTNSVFEDLTPRLADLDGDGLTEVIAVVSDAATGSRLSIWGLVDGVLTERAASEPIGRPNRWLNPLPVYDKAPVMAVITPHLGGPLLQWRFEDGALSKSTRLGGETLFSNHAIGSRDLSTAVRQDEDWAVPERERRALIFGRGDEVVHRLTLDFTIADDMAIIGDAVVMRSAAGKLYATAFR
ncbi:PliI family lysozyme inhibitor of I-type lysozyme [Notoacmeibacter sp. MSK16QG-6]|uniref:PliI family lysozyme inhibitor of I-type lysozyme n=1 Tax=Notoacmeibacter sp. MSK16QG-6 TaxID=2957982 RepID=UPI0020A16C6E|nr:PliI family lysozyme inhibitor of I-type lysozyme [Notoacmeibacter sp. MSK16QG-6]MCP1198234.1 PliI family lysozyme inhibitor of I-type lysozyme [Notoacmeibacter sp. MSK16QG-6]